MPKIILGRRKQCEIFPGTEEEFMGMEWGQLGLQTIPENFVPEGEELECDFRDDGKPVKFLSRNRV